MVLNESIVPNVSINTSSIVSSAVDAGKSAIFELLSPFMWIIQAIGVVLLLYILFLFIKAIMKFKDHLRLARIEKKLDFLIENEVSKAKLKKFQESSNAKKEEIKEKKKSKKSLD